MLMEFKMFMQLLPFIISVIGFVIFSSSIYFLRNYIDCLRLKNKEPKIASELTIFILLISGFSLFSFGCYLI